MFGRLMPREGRFFDYFNEHAEQIVLGAEELVALMGAVAELDERKRNIENIEHRADKITAATMDLLHHTFITPIDRDEIHSLIGRMDDILDLMEDVSQCMFLYDIHEVTDAARELAELCLTSAQKVKLAVSQLKDLKHSKNILQLCGEIDRLEGDSDRVMRSAMAKLFRDGTDALTVLKMKEIYQLLESVTDRCQDVANIIEGIVIENS
ncbi:MAG: DUF47 domain-containing protein [Panacagrimonas sp.]